MRTRVFTLAIACVFLFSTLPSHGQTCLADPPPIHKGLPKIKITQPFLKSARLRTGM